MGHPSQYVLKGFIITICYYITDMVFEKYRLCVANPKNVFCVLRYFLNLSCAGYFLLLISQLKYK